MGSCLRWLLALIGKALVVFVVAAAVLYLGGLALMVLLAPPASR